MLNLMAWVLCAAEDGWMDGLDEMMCGSLSDALQALRRNGL